MTTDIETRPLAVDAVQKTVGVNGTHDLTKLMESAANGATNGTINGPASYPEHPLGPLSASEISRASALIRAFWPEGTAFLFKVITLLEPPKADLVPWLAAERAGSTRSTIDRRSFVVYYLKNTVGRSRFGDLLRC